ncbi:MAG: hypothetical protein WB988_27115 [Candidatus Nitrosopolaris sp.]|jgi:hypothetical protein
MLIAHTQRGVGVGTSANTTFLLAQAQPPNVKQEVDTNEGQNRTTRMIGTQVWNRGKRCSR